MNSLLEALADRRNDWVIIATVLGCTAIIVAMLISNMTFNINIGFDVKLTPIVNTNSVKKTP